jgi:hypothetical protein
MRGLAIVVLALLLEAAVLLQLAVPGPGGEPAGPAEMARAHQVAPRGAAEPCRDGKKC